MWWKGTNIKGIVQFTSFDADSDELDSEGWLCKYLCFNLNSLCTLIHWTFCHCKVKKINKWKCNLLVGMCFLQSSVKGGKHCESKCNAIICVAVIIALVKTEAVYLKLCGDILRWLWRRQTFSLARKKKSQTEEYLITLNYSKPTIITPAIPNTPPSRRAFVWHKRFQQKRLSSRTKACLH